MHRPASESHRLALFIWFTAFTASHGILDAMTNGGRGMEFGVRVDRMSGQYSVTPDELPEIRGRAAKLFSRPPGGAGKH